MPIVRDRDKFVQTLKSRENASPVPKRSKATEALVLASKL